MSIVIFSLYKMAMFFGGAAAQAPFQTDTARDALVVGVFSVLLPIALTGWYWIGMYRRREGSPREYYPPMLYAFGVYVLVSIRLMLPLNGSFDGMGLMFYLFCVFVVSFAGGGIMLYIQQSGKEPRLLIQYTVPFLFFLIVLGLGRLI
ncbi:MAG: hypothetical protein ACM3QZ_00900 [Solirubrobacterales bacterium]